MIAQGLGFTGNFLKERNNSAYSRLKKIPCGFKQQARARHTGEKCGLVQCVEPQYPPAHAVPRRLLHDDRIVKCLLIAYFF